MASRISNIYRLKWGMAVLVWGFIFSALNAQQIPGDTLQVHPDTSRIHLVPVPQDTLIDTTAAAQITPWRFTQLPGYSLAATDSSLRWQMWPDWLYMKNRESGVITYRRGRVGFNDAMLVNAHESRHQQLRWEGMLMNDPVTGTVRWTEIPHHKINHFYVDRNGGLYRTNFTLKQYYVNKPESRFNYDESRFNYRSLEFMVTRNFSRRTNAEISYWLRRDGAAYPRDQSQGNQIYTRFYHHLDSNRFLKASFLHNAFNLQQSFGYRMSSMRTFRFERFAAQPLRPSASSDWNSNDLNLGYYHRNRSVFPKRYRANLFLSTDKRRMKYAADTSLYRVGSIRGSLQGWQDWKGIELFGQLTAGQYWDRADIQAGLQRDSWSRLASRFSAALNPHPDFQLTLQPHLNWRSDGFSTWELGAEIDWNMADILRVGVDASQGQYMPTPQQLYWSSASYQGNSNLQGEHISSAGGNLVLDLSHFSTGIRGRVKQIKNGIFIRSRQDSMFHNMEPYYSGMAEVFFQWDRSHFELNGSATAHLYKTTSEDVLLQQLDQGGPRMWLKGSAFIKGYVLDRAAYIKAGMFGMFSPRFYRSSRYYPTMDIWQSAHYEEEIPPFYRVDLELTARVRTLMLHIRWENVTNNLGQLGYFETARYPMPGRRFMFGLRVLFTN